MRILQKKFETSIGTLYCVVSDKGLQHLSWWEQSAPMLTEEKSPSAILIKKVEKQLKEYLAGSREVFDLPLDLIGTDFQKRVWAALLAIPYGKTSSYKEIATAIKNNKACRAVGTANGRNPICIIVPCHRVINANGELGGYSSGLPRKVKLLALERSLS